MSKLPVVQILTCKSWCLHLRTHSTLKRWTDPENMTLKCKKINLSGWSLCTLHHLVAQSDMYIHLWWSRITRWQLDNDLSWGWSAGTNYWYTCLWFFFIPVYLIYSNLLKSVCMNPYHREHSWMASRQMPWCTGKSLAIQKMSEILQVLSVKETHALLNIV